VVGKVEPRRPVERVWYDEARENPEQQFAMKLCFKDVYQFRQELARILISQTRNFHYHRNTPDRVIVWCKKEKNKWDCPFPSYLIKKTEIN
jgi:hypothetical protein